MTNLTEARGFLKAVFGADWETRSILSWSADLQAFHNVRGGSLDELPPDANLYWSVGAFPVGAPAVRKLSAADGVRALVLDDVGTKISSGAALLGLGAQTSVVESSLGNYQWAYRLSRELRKDEWAQFSAGVKALIGVAKLDGDSAVHIFRLPLGRNTKPEAKGFLPRITMLDANNSLDVDQVLAAGAAAGAGGASGTSGGAAPPSTSSLTVEALRGLMALIPNDDEVSYDEWISTGQRMKARCPEGVDVWEEWSAKSSKDGVKYDTRSKWDTFDPTRTAGLELDVQAEAADAGGYAAWKQGLAAGGAGGGRGVFDDGLVPPDPFKTPPGKPPPGAGGGGGGGGGSGGGGVISATPYVWQDPKNIPPRDWLYGRLLIRRFISMTVAPGGVGKSSLIAAEALAQVTGRNLLGENPSGALRVWLWNLEDPAEETARKLQAAALRYQVSEGDVGGRLFVDSGRTQRLVTAEMQGGRVVIVRPVVDALVREVRRWGIDVVVVDPFVASHAVPENDNTAQNAAIKEWGWVAEHGGCAVHLVDHTRKGLPGAEVETESARGAKAKTDAARVVRVVNRMTPQEGKAWGIGDPWRYFNVFNDKANMAPPVDVRDWFHLESVGLGNGMVGGGAGAGGLSAMPTHAGGDMVGVVASWDPPSPQVIAASANVQKVATAMKGRKWRKDPRSPDWIGKAVAEGLEISLTPKGKALVNRIIDEWTGLNVFRQIQEYDKERKLRDYIEIDEFAPVAPVVDGKNGDF